MTSPTPHPIRQPSLSSSSSTSDASDEVDTGDTRIAFDGHSPFPTMNSRTVFSQSSPNLGHQLAGANDSESSRDATMHPPQRTHSHGAAASHFLGQLNDTYGGQTWIDFLRDSGSDPNPGLQQRPAQSHAQPNLHAPLPPLPHDSFQGPDSPRYAFPPRSSSHNAGHSSRSATERKRRLTTADSPFRRPSNIRMHSENQPGSSSNPVLLGSSPVAEASRRPSLQPPSGAGRRDSDYVLPRWQPDSEVTHCFVCGSHFTFFYRKHHCRKCGRVVCSACSPHRITIPRQYIVHPPQESPNIIDLTSDDDDRQMSRYGPFGNPALGGGEEVRVCNPCVPDPNYDPPQQHGQTSPFPPFSPSAHSPHLPPSNMPPRGSRSSHRSTQSVSDSMRPGHAPRTRDPRDPFTDHRTSYHGPTRVSDLFPPPQALPAYDPRIRPHSRSLAGSSDHAGPEHVSGRRAFYTSRPQPPPPPPAPRRQIAEEDECPVCGDELPPKGPDGDDSARTQHVSECIALHSGSPPPIPPSTSGGSGGGSGNAQTSTSLPSQRTRGMSSAALGGGGGGEGSARASMSMRGMVPYVATEKDCVDEGGGEAECVICFEEFEAGVRMARLVCWCKFHEACIREWWEKKGRGACPTHQLQY